MPHPAVQAMESEVNKARDQLENQESKLSRLEATVKVERDEMKKLRRHLRNTKKLFEPEALRKTDLEEEAAEGDDPVRPPEDTVPASRDKSRFSEHTYTKFRGWVYEDKERTFSAAEAHDALRISAIREVIRAAVDRGFLIEVPDYRPKGFQGGRLPLGYRYNTEAKERPVRIPGSDLGAAPVGGRGSGSGPIAGINGDALGGVHKDIKAVLTNALANGAYVARNGGGHLKLFAEGKRPVMLPDSPNGRALKNLKRDMRGAGFAL